METETEEKIYIESPFTRLSGNRVIPTPVVINDIDKYNKLLEREQEVLKYAVKFLNILTGVTELNVEKIAVLHYGTYTDAKRKAIKRAIAGLIEQEILAPAPAKHIYWINRNVIWR